MRRVRIFVVLVLAALACGGVAARLRYPGMTAGLWSQMRYTGVSESRNAGASYALRPMRG